MSELESQVDESCGHFSVVSRTFQVGNDQITWNLCQECKQTPQFLEFIVKEKKLIKKRVKKDDSQSSTSTPRTSDDTRGNQHV